MLELVIVILILLIIIAIIDGFFKSVPSILITSVLLVSLLSQFVSAERGLMVMAFAGIGLIYAYMLYEASFIGGMADIKVIVIISSLIASIPLLFVFFLLVLLFGMAYKLTFRYILKKDHAEEIPFIPCLTAVYIVLLIIGGLVYH